MIRTGKAKRKVKIAGLYCASALVLLASLVQAAEKAAPREEGQFNIFVLGQEVGREKFSIQSSGKSVTSSSTMNFHDPANRRREVKIDTQLSMNDGLVPLSYQLRTEIEGKKGAIRATFAPGQATYEYQTDGSPRKTVLLVGDHFSMLDTNIFHHFSFIARLFDFDSKDTWQSMEVVIPQEMQNGVLKVSNLGIEKISVRGKERELHHLRANTGTVAIDLWTDDDRIVYKIALPGKGIEVIRG